MTTQQILMRTAEQIKEQNKNNLKIEMYWDYNDKLSEQQILKIIKEEDGLNDIENEIWENSIEYIGQREQERLKEIMTEEEYQEDSLREEVLDYLEFDLNINQLLRNSSIHLRIELLSNEDMIYYENLTDNTSYTFKEFKRVFRKGFNKEEMQKEINNLTSDYGLITFYFKLSGNNILRFREEYLKGFITLKKGLQFGFFNSWVGGGSLLEVNLLRNITLNLKDWRIKNQKEAVIKGLKEGNTKSYYEVQITADNLSKYGINEVYGLCSSAWLEW